MRQTLDEKRILERAVSALERSSGLRAEALPAIWRNGQAQTPVDIYVGNRPIRFAGEVRNVDRFEVPGTLSAREGPSPSPTLLVAPYISDAIAERCRALNLPFIDEAGNAYLEAPGLFVWVTGRRRTMPVRTSPTFRAMTAAGLRITFALLCQPELASASYRDIARVAGVALGTVGKTLEDLHERGYLTPEANGPRRLLAPVRLRDEWVTHYPIKLRPKLDARRFSALQPNWWHGLDLSEHHAWWGGEAAAEKLTGYLKAERITLYVDGKPDPLILAGRLRPDDRGNIEILQSFWAEAKTRPADRLAPALIVYADLMASSDPRNIETARLIRDQYLDNTDHAE